MGRFWYDAMISGLFQSVLCTFIRNFFRTCLHRTECLSWSISRITSSPVPILFHFQLQTQIRIATTMALEERASEGSSRASEKAKGADLRSTIFEYRTGGQLALINLFCLHIRSKDIFITSQLTSSWMNLCLSFHSPTLATQRVLVTTIQSDCQTTSVREFFEGFHIS